MKICILTQPLGTNYGGLLQAYALQTVLKRLGHDVWTEDRYIKSNLLKNLKNYVKIILGPIRHRYYPTAIQTKIIRENTDRFIHDYIRTTERISSNNKSEFVKYNFDAYVVGSDQVWRPRYSPYLPNYFLDFTNGQDVKRVAYAASFGTDVWEFSEEETIYCGQLAKHFDAISVREDSGVGLCKDYFGVDAELVLDPTMLLTKDDYEKLLSTNTKNKNKKTYLMQYILDETTKKQLIIDTVKKELNIEDNAVIKPYPKNYWYEGPKNIKDCVYPSVQDWLQSFIDADFVVTDSFHGTVFSIIFNKQFISIPNTDRGLTRFKSLLNMFRLENRMVESLEQARNILKYSINFSEVQKRLSEERDKSIVFLTKINQL